MALPASDSFTGSNGTALPAHNAAWVNAVNGIEIQSNAAAASVALDDNYAYWTGDTFAADQYSKASVSDLLGSTHYGGVIARASGSGGTFQCYICTTDGSSGVGHTEIGKVVGNSYAVLKAVATTFTAGDVIEIRCTGTSTTTIAFYKNGVLIDSVTDSSSPLTSGSPGIDIFDGAMLDEWEGGNLSSDSTTTAMPGVGSVTINGRAPTTSTSFSNVRIRDVLVTASGQPVGNAANITLCVWYSGHLGGAPDVSLNGMTTDANGTASWSIPTGTLAYQQPIFFVAQDSISYSNYTAGRLVPSYE